MCGVDDLVCDVVGYSNDNSLDLAMCTGRIVVVYRYVRGKMYNRGKN